MEELQKALAASIRGRDADRAVRRIRRQIHRWGLSLPAVPPVVFDFGLGDFRRIGEVEFWLANEVEAGYCGKFLFVFLGQTCPSHHHQVKLETFFIVRGRVRMFYNGKEHILGTGDSLRVEPGKDHGFTGIKPTLLLEVSKPSLIADNYFHDREIPIGGNYRGSGDRRRLSEAP